MICGKINRRPLADEGVLPSGWRLGPDDGVGVYVCVGGYLPVVSDDGGAADGCPAADDGSPAYPHWVILSGRILDSAMIVGLEVVEDELVCLQEVLGPPRVLLQALYLLDVDFCSFAYA